jgi:hypothetical protein
MKPLSKYWVEKPFLFKKKVLKLGIQKAVIFDSNYNEVYEFFR